MKPRPFAVVLAAGVALAATPLGAQESLLPSMGWGLGWSLSAWHFTTALPQSSGALADVAEVAIPFRVRSVFGRWNLDLSGAAVAGAAHFTAGAAQQALGGTGGQGDEGGDRATTIYGPTDLKLRMTGPLLGDNLLLTAGVNIPTGKVGLNTDETNTLQAIGAPALRMPVGAFGTGAGFTLGVIRAFQGDEWAFALGGSVEQRSEYAPIALLLSTGKAETKVTPGTAAHITLGFDRSLGEHRLSALVVGDLFSKDKVRFDQGGGAEGINDFTLGPQVTLTTRLDFASSHWRESGLSLAARTRGQFSDASGTTVAGSSGTYFEGSLGGVLGGADGKGFIVAVDGRMHSGLKFTDSLMGAAVTAVGLTLGVETQRARTSSRFVVSGQYGTFDTGKASTTGFGVTIGMSVGARREAR